MKTISALSWILLIMTGGTSTGFSDVGPKRAAVQSASIASIGYDQRSKTLEVEFRSGALYRYREVPEAVHVEFLRAKSKGRFFSESVRGRYGYEKLSRVKR